MERFVRTERQTSELRLVAALGAAAILYLNQTSLRIDTASQTVTVDHAQVDLSPTEFKLLRALAEEAGIALSQERLFRKTWGDVYKGQSNLVDVYIHRLRKKLETDASSPKRILTVRGAGYKLSE